MTNIESYESVPALTDELLDLMEHEKVIDQGLASFIDVGCALIAIKADRKYIHAGYSTFEDYCRDRWQISRPQAYRLVSAASVAEGLMSPIGDIGLEPTSESQVRPLAALKSVDDQREAWAEAVDAADGGQPTAAEVKQAVAKRLPTKPVHPAKFSDKILATIAEHVGPAEIVLDPFAGTGRIHELASDTTRTIGVEIEPDWPGAHPDNIQGNALDLLAIVGAESVDAIATSPTYGNRMADSHNAKDDSVRLTYTHTIGHDLDPDNSGAMQWGDKYRSFHEAAWQQSVAVLKPGGTFTLNIKNHIRNGEIQRVAEWHINALMRRHHLEMVALDVLTTKGVDAGANADRRTGFELVVTFRKPVTQ